MAYDLDTMMLRDSNPNLFVKQRMQDQMAQALNMYAAQQNTQRASDLRAQVPQQRADADLYRALEAWGMDPGKRTRESLGAGIALGEIGPEAQKNRLASQELDNNQKMGQGQLDLGREKIKADTMGDVLAAVSGGGRMGAMGGMGMGGGGMNPDMRAIIGGMLEGSGVQLPPQRDKAAELEALLKTPGKTPPEEGSRPAQGTPYTTGAGIREGVGNTVDAVTSIPASVQAQLTAFIRGLSGQEQAAPPPSAMQPVPTEQELLQRATPTATTVNPIQQLWEMLNSAATSPTYAGIAKDRNWEPYRQ